MLRCVLAVVWLVLAASAASAQLVPAQRYAAAGRPLWMNVTVSGEAAGPAVIRLHRMGEERPEAEAVVSPGLVDVSEVFAMLRRGEALGTLWAQLYVGDVPTGSPVVLSRLETPDRAVAVEPDGGVLFESERWQRQYAAGQVNEPDRPVMFNGYVAYVDRHVVLETSEGPIELRLRPDAAPLTARWFLELVEGGFYQDIPFHRIVNRLEGGDRFLVQTGDPTGTGHGGSGSHIDLEPSSLPHDYAVISMARGAAPDTASSQFFICLGRAATAGLDGAYAAFAEIVGGGEALEAIARTAVDGAERPITPPLLRRARAIDAPPWGRAAERIQEPRVAVER